MKRFTVAKHKDLAPGTCRTVQAGGIAVALCRVGDRFYAVDNTCPHAGGPLGEGTLDGTILTCPWHEWSYDVRTGQRPDNPEIAVPTYSVELKGDDVIVQVPPESA